MKKYIVFAFDNHYPRGGANDVKFCTNDFERAKGVAYDYRKDNDYDNAQIYDLEKEIVVWSDGQR